MLVPYTTAGVAQPDTKAHTHARTHTNADTQMPTAVKLVFTVFFYAEDSFVDVIVFDPWQKSIKARTSSLQ